MTQELSKIISATSDARLKLRLLAVSHFLDGKNRTQISKYLKVSRTSVNGWIQTYLIQGISGLKEKKHTGRPKGLTEIQLSQLKEYIVSSAVKPDGGRLQGIDVKRYILAEFGIEYKKSNIYNLLHALNLSWITTRSKHPKQSIEVQEDFKKIPNKNDP